MKKRFMAGSVIFILAVLFILIGRPGEAASMGILPDKEEKNIIHEETPSAPEDPVENLVNEALENNPELKFYEAEIEEAKGARKNAGLWSNPEVESSIGQKRVSGSSEGGESTTSKGVASEIVVTQTLEWPGRIRLRKAIANRDIELAELGLAQFRAVLAARVRSAVVHFMASQEKAAATNESADHFRDLRKVLTERDQAGLTAVLETRIIEAMELNIRRKASAASLALQSALHDLNQLRGASPRTTLNLGKLDLKFHSLKENKEELIELARKNDYQVRLRALELERQDYGVKLAKNERFPAITAGPMISQERAGERERIIGAAISMPLPLWDWNQGHVAVAKAHQTQAELALEIAQREAERRIIEAINIYETKLGEMATWQPDSIQHFKEAAELADRHYRLGSVPVSTYVALQSQYLETIEGLQDTKKEALEAAAQLELLTGVELPLADITSSKTS